MTATRSFTIKVGYYCRQTVLPDDPNPARGYRGYVEKSIQLRTDQLVIGCMHINNIGYAGGIPWQPDSPAWGIVGGIESVKRQKCIVADHLAHLIRAAHAVGVRVMFMIPGWQSAENYPQWRMISSRVKEPSGIALPRCPNCDWRQEFLTDVFGPRRAEASAVVKNLIDIAPPVKPAPQDWVVTTTLQSTTLLNEAGIDTILFAGFDTNGCLRTSAGGVLPMAGLGYRPIVLRDCTTNGEDAQGAETLAITRAALRSIEMFRGYSASGDEVREALSR